MFSSFTLWFPIVAEQLPDTLVSTMQRSVPHIKVGTWQQWVVWIRNQYLSWLETDVFLLQAQVADNVLRA